MAQGAYEVAWDLCEGEGLFMPLDVQLNWFASPLMRKHVARSGQSGHPAPWSGRRGRSMSRVWLVRSGNKHGTRSFDGHSYVGRYRDAG